MRENLPVTQREYALPDHATLMSTTDVTSRLTYANDAFVAASGFSREELMGEPHNMVRHPDMPPEAFRDMWQTLKDGQPWTGIVKNRRKDGDHYWVRANATPVIRHGRTTGYMSVRTKPTADEVAAADALYRDMREGRARGRSLHRGLVVRSGLMGWTRALQTVSVRWRVQLPVMLMAAAFVGAGFAAGLASTSLAIFSAAVIFGMGLLGAWLHAQIIRPLEQMRDQALRISTGDTQESLHMNRTDEIGLTMRTIGQLGLMFRWIIDDVSGQVLTAQSATNEIAQGNSDLSSRTEQAAASVEQTASSMEQMTATVRNNAETASQANVLSGSASVAAERGGRAVSDVVATMTEISQSSRKIADIVGVIDDIAFQTNILALNAAVEAARAGEEGRGFAVVASEVRRLAHRSAEAAKEIKSLIHASVDKVESGSRLVDDAGKTMQDIVNQVNRVSSLIAEISSATTQQSAGIAQVGQAIGHLDTVTQQNAALVEQSTAASESLRTQMGSLAEAVGVFR